MSSDGPVIPKQGDITICMTCTALLEFDKDISPATVDIKSLEPEVQDLIVAAIAHIQAGMSGRTLH